LNEQLSSARSGKLLAPTYIFDQRLTAGVLGEIAAQVNHPLIEANIDITGVEVKIRSGETGREMNSQPLWKKFAV
jgi:hypothetical protein